MFVIISPHVSMSVLKTVLKKIDKAKGIILIHIADVPMEVIMHVAQEHAMCHFYCWLISSSL